MRAEELTLEEKCRLLGGASTWRTHAIDGAGVPAVKMSDGPAGVRGDGLGAVGTPGVVVPSGIALGATWDPGLVGRLGVILGREARRRRAHVLLAPTINLQRTPIGGRVFECLSEDPELTARLAVAYVREVQSQEVAVAVKHFVVNDTERDRFTVDVHADERTLRELYLRPFEAVVTEAQPWGLMSAYNQLDGIHCSEHRWLLTEVLRDEWGFDGFVVSDWFGFHDTAASANAGLTMPMPGPHTPYGDALVTAVEQGDVDEVTVDGLVAEVLRLVERTGAVERSSEAAEESVDDPGERATCRAAVAAGTILVRNEDATLPLAAGADVVVIGVNAADTRIMGGGSASLEPLPHRSILDGLRERDLTVTYEEGVRIDRMAPPASATHLRTPDGDPGLVVTYRNGTDADGPVVHTEVATSSALRWFGSTPPGVDPNAFHVTIEGSFVPWTSGPHTISAVSTGPSSVVVRDEHVLDDPEGTGPRGDFFFGLGSAEHLATQDMEEGVAAPFRAWLVGAGGFAGVRLGFLPPDDPERVDRAVAAAAAADVAVVVVGTNDEWETEGEDRTTIALPGEQDEVVRRVAAAAARTVVVVNTGSPVAMPWRDEVDAILVAHFGGTAMGEGVADVLVGDVDPGGRLPTTWPHRLEDAPAWPHYLPVDGVQAYGEGLAMGYRGHPAPLFPFGHGLSYGDAIWQDADVPASVVAGEDLELHVPVEATGDRDATVVVQAYLGPTVDGDPAMRLAGFTKAVVRAGDTDRIPVTVPAASFRRWDPDAGAWTVDPGPRELHLARSATDIVQSHTIEILPG